MKPFFRLRIILFTAVMMLYGHCSWNSARSYANSPEKDFILNPEIGRIISSYSGTDMRDITIILDAHSNFEAQQNIARILSILTDTYSPAIIGIEGAVGDISIVDFQTFPITSARNSVSKYFLKEARINGVEYFNITTDNTLTDYLTTGVEDRKIYQQNLSAYKSFTKQSAEYLKTIKKLNSTLDALAEKTFSAKQLEFDQLLTLRNNHKITFIDFAHELINDCKIYSIPISPFKNISLLKKSFQYKKSIKPYRLEAESKQISDMLIKTLPKTDPFRKRYYSFMLGKLQSEQYYKILADRCRLEKWSLAKFPQFQEYLTYLDQTTQINHSQLYTESIELTAKLAQKVFPSYDTSQIYTWKNRARILKKLCSLNLSSDEYKILQNDKKIFDTDVLISFLQKKGSALAKDNLLKHDIESIHTQSSVFYTIASKRNKIMLNNLLAEMDMEDIDNGCIVVGGFHAEGIAELLKKQGISYSIISPAVTINANMALYQSRLNESQTPFESALENSITALIIQNKSTIPYQQLAIASQLTSEPLGNPAHAQAIRIELKSLMSVEAIRELERSGLYRLDELSSHVDNILITHWAKEHFSDLRSYRMYRGEYGRLVVELNINNRIFTFVGNPEDSKPIPISPDRQLARINLNDTTITVLEGSDFQHSESYDFAESLLTQLSKKTLTIDEIKTTLNPSDKVLNTVLKRWIAKGFVFLGPNQNPQLISLSPRVRALLPTIDMIRKSFFMNPDSFKSLPQSIQTILHNANIQQIVIDRTTPIQVVLEFLIDLDRGIITPKPTKIGTTPFHLVDTNYTYDAILNHRGPAQQGLLLELRATENPAIPFDTTVRDKRLADIFSDSSALTEAIQQKTQYTTFTQPPSTPPSLPLSPTALYHQQTINRIFNYIGNPQTFKTRNKALVFDLDGTLAIPNPKTGEFKQIDPQLIKSIKKLIGQGINIVLISGQSMHGIQQRFLKFFDKTEFAYIHLYANSGASAIGFDKEGNQIRYYKDDLKSKINTLEQLKNSLADIADQMNIKGHYVRINDVQISYKLNGIPEQQRIAFFNAVTDLVNKMQLPLKVGLAGRTTIDIALRNKSDAIRDFMKNRVDVSPADILMFGDSYDGNDYPMLEAAPNSTHFHVGQQLKTIPDNVVQADNMGPASTLYILQQLNQIIDLAVDKQIYEDRLKSVMLNNTAYYDFHHAFSSETPIEKLQDSFIFPIWYATNEPEWEEAIAQLEKGGFTDTLLGVSANSVNLSYIAASDLKQAVVLDLNPTVTQLFLPLRNTLISLADNRIEYLSLLARKPVKKIIRDEKTFYQPAVTFPEGTKIPEISIDASIPQIRDFFGQIKISDTLSKNIISTLRQLFPEQLRTPLTVFWQQNTRRGFEYRQVLKALIDADTRAGQPVSWLSNEKRFKKVKNFIQDGRLFGIEANWATQTISNLATLFTEQGNKINIEYLSNVHHKIPATVSPEGVSPLANFYSNIAAFPRSNNFIILSDRSLKGDNTQGVSSYDKSPYEKINTSWRNEQFDKKPLTPSVNEITKRQKQQLYAGLIRNLLTKYEHSDLADYYFNADPITQKAILTFFASNIKKQWSDIRQQLRSGKIFTGNDKQLVDELESLFGIGLVNLESVLNHFDDPFDFYMQLLSQPYETVRVFIQKTFANTVTELIRAVGLFTIEPDIVLIDSSILEKPTTTTNFALSKMLDLYREEHISMQERRVLFVAIDTIADDAISARKKLDRSLFTRGDNSTLFDSVLAIQYNPFIPAEKNLFNMIRSKLGTQATDNTVLTEFQRRKLIQIIQQQFGIAPDRIDNRVTILTQQNTFLSDFSAQTGSGLRIIPTDKPNSKTEHPTGTLLIDILRTIGDQALPSNLRITDVRSKIAISAEQKNLNFDLFLELFRSIFGIYSALDNTHQTYGGLLDAIANARTDGRISPSQSELLAGNDEIHTIFAPNLDQPLIPDKLVEIFMQVVLTQLKVSDKIKLATTIQTQYKVLVLKAIVDHQKSAGHPIVTITDIRDKLIAAHSNLQDIASYLQVDVPPRPISTDLNKTIAAQRTFDLSA